MTSSPYKSKVLNFVSEKYRQILDRSDRVFNQVKFATTNTIQLLLYPIYVLLQTSRLAVKQLGKKASVKKPQITNKVNNETTKNHQNTNQPIQQASLTTIQTVTPPAAKLPVNTSTSSLIKPKSELFPRLDIKFENQDTLADNHQKSELLTKDQQKQPLILTAYLENNTPLQLQPCAEIAPNSRYMSIFWQIMAWVQTSQIALWFNLFEELKLPPEKNKLIQEKNNYQTLPLLSSSNLIFRDFINNIAKHYIHPITRSLGLNELLPPINIEELPFESLLEVKQEEDQVQNSSQKTIFTSNNSANIETIRFRENRGRSIKTLTKTNEQNFSQTTKNAKVSIQYYSREDSRPDYQQEQDCLEVASVSIGYIKHPLEEILGWVDVVMTWIEKVFAQVWQWSQKKLKNI
ncbi:MULTISPECIES: hypothetical protein [Okeania]|uniref:Uncharacterized protein n=1 Tax=Okeania hirsuta TaxID=1458930 RepID=A0A3N6PK92_9CYAN|nr:MULTISPECIES: hypothetical protein [Okeania]NEP04108.1 hypothetical protein [Okeania sp. SIO4D6]NET12769.1 hypothetical protein [Okeania sp. SIO1H6]NEP73532.1 hypothetical protein [Okeania sp. SIO2G5]NEP95876.1 hypothetical protein [Okeania sp. SIO2F5]NEQ94190.1 hypothetical protein [Okeania sp. SIO2G4]